MTNWLVASLCVAAASGKWRFPDFAVDFAADVGNGTETLAHACGPAAPLPPAIEERLYFFAFVTSANPELLRHFLAFYAGRGVRFGEPGRARLVLNPPVDGPVAGVAAANVFGAANYSRRDGAASFARARRRRRTNL
jgi:hypothetical protein